mgnify:CR=1 FL=1
MVALAEGERVESQGQLTRIFHPPMDSRSFSADDAKPEAVWRSAPRLGAPPPFPQMSQLLFKLSVPWKHRWQRGQPGAGMSVLVTT